MFMKGPLVLYISLSLGYVLCVLASKQKDVLKTVGYTLGVAILILSLGQALVVTYIAKCPPKGWFAGKPFCQMAKTHQRMMK
jgi:hypothetical protein